MQIIQGFAMLTISTEMMGKRETIYPTIIWDEEKTVLVDTGYPGQLPLIQQEIEQAGAAFHKLDTIIITHQDIDHIGNLSAIQKEQSQSILVLASEIEKPYIQGDKMLIKLTPEAIAKSVSTLPPEVPEDWRRAFKHTLENPPKGPVHQTVEDGEELLYGGGLIVIATPGHTPGHLSLYHKPSKTLIAGDAMIVSDGRLLGPDPRYCVDAELSIQSLKMLKLYDIEAVICYHGGLYNNNVNKRIAELADK